MIIIKKAVEIGNGAAVYIPREYKGREVLITIYEGLEDIKKRVLNKLIDFMPNICGVYLYGSYARNEEEAGSDVDILIITKEKDERINWAFNTSDNIDARVLTIDSIKKNIENFPVFILPILKEAKIFLNPLLIEQLRKEKINPKKLYWNFDDNRRIVKITRGIIEINDKNMYNSLVYSLVMRIRICFMAECLLKNKIFSNKAVKELIIKYFNEKTYEKFYRVYKLIRDRKEKEIEKENIKINKEETQKLAWIVEKYTKKLEDETEKKIGKRN